VSLIDETLLRQGAHNWYRNTRWSGEIEVAFSQKLGRARGQWHQYLAIQMLQLKERYPEAALRLADYYLGRKADDESGFSFGPVMQWSALAYEKLDRLDEAVRAYLEAMAWQAVTPGHQIGIEKDFAAFAARHHLSEQYELILSALDPDVFAQMKGVSAAFRTFAVTAIFENDYGDKARAIAPADQALQCLGGGNAPDSVPSGSAPSVSPELLERLQMISTQMRPAKEHMH